MNFVKVKVSCKNRRELKGGVVRPQKYSRSTASDHDASISTSFISHFPS